MLISMWTNAEMFRVNGQNVLRRLQRSLSVACVMHWSRCQSLPGPDGPIPPRHAGAALPRPWSGGACTHALVGTPTPRIANDCRVKNMRRGRGCFLEHEYIGFSDFASSVATQLSWGGSLYDRSIENFLRNLTLKDLWKSVFICRSNDEKQSVCFTRNSAKLTGVRTC